MSGEAISVGSVFYNLVATIEKKLFSGNHSAVEKTAQNVKIASIAAMAITGIAALFFACNAVTSLAVTFGFSIVLVVPAAAIGYVGYEAYKVMRCADIVIERAKGSNGTFSAVANAVKDGLGMATSGLPTWAQNVQNEIEGTYLLSWYVRQSQPAS